MKPMASVTSNLVQKLSSLSSRKKSCQENQVSSQSDRSENIKTEILKILIWDDPILSCCCILLVNIVFWLIIYLDLKFYGIIFITLFILTCEQLWMEYFSRPNDKNKPESQNVASLSSKTFNRRMFGSAEVNGFFKGSLNMLNDTYVKAKLFRQSQPGMFCALTCLCFLLIGVIGKSFSGLTSVYFLLMIVMTVPGAFARFLPPDAIKSLSDLFYYSHKGDSDSEDEVEPYLLDTNEEALKLLRLAGDLQLPNKEDDEDSNDLLLEHISDRTNDTIESVSSKFSFYPESAVMPSPENSMDYWESDVNFWGKTQPSDSLNNDINFQSQHFDGDSSEEEEFVKGLDLSKEATPNPTGEDLLRTKPVPTPENLISVGKNRAVKQSKKNSTGSDKESSSDTDSFEMISEGDM